MNYILQIKLTIPANTVLHVKIQLPLIKLEYSTLVHNLFLSIITQSLLHSETSEGMRIHQARVLNCNGHNVIILKSTKRASHCMLHDKSEKGVRQKGAGNEKKTSTEKTG